MLSPPRDARPRSARVLRAALVALLASACGHPASEAECQLVVDRNVELTVAAMTTPPKDVEAEKARVRAEMEPVLRACVGRRITDKKVACVRRATSIREADGCMR